MCFTRRKLIYSCFGYEKYISIVSKLAAEGINYRTRFVNNNRSMGGHMSSMDRTVQYDILVKKEDEHKALQVIHRN